METKIRMTKLIYSVLLCHFIAAFSALGMPLFLPMVIPTLGTNIDAQWIGILFILPTLCTATASRFWGLFADKYSKRLSLLRAQVGLTAGFVLCGLATDLPTFVIGLIVQGTFGGTMAASNSYLSSQISDRKKLGQTLNKTQQSARLALIVAPISLGFTLSSLNPLNAYLWLAILPLFAFALTLHLPKDQPVLSDHQKDSNNQSLNNDSGNAQHNGQLSKIIKPSNIMVQLYILQFMFAFCMVVTFPYFAPFAQSKSIDSSTMIGFLYALPHLVYLLLASVIHKWSTTSRRILLVGFTTLAISNLTHLLPYMSSLIVARLLFGIGIVLCFHGLHQSLSHHFSKANSGRVFSRFDAMSKWGGVIAGLCASYVSGFGYLSVPFIISSLISFLAVLMLTYTFKEWEQHVIDTKFAHR